MRGKFGENPTQPPLPLQSEYPLGVCGNNAAICRDIFGYEECSRLVNAGAFAIGILLPVHITRIRTYVCAFCYPAYDNKGAFVMQKYTRDDAVEMLKAKYDELGKRCLPNATILTMRRSLR